MEFTILQFLLSLIFLLIAYLFHLSRRHPKYNLPPSPPNSLPILGHLHLLKPSVPLHHTFHLLSQKYGPIISLRFGTRQVVVVSSSAAAQECFTKNDIVLANRPRLLVGKYFSYNYTGMIHAPYGDHWRNLRRIGSIEIFSNHRLNSFLVTRKDEIRRLIMMLSSKHEAQDFKLVELRRAFQDLTFNIIMRMISGERYYGDDESFKEELMEIKKLLKVVGGRVSKAGNFLPVLNWLSGFEREMAKVAKRFDSSLQGLVDELKRNRCLKASANTMIDHLLSLQESQPEYYTDEIIKGLVAVMLFAGIDTSSVTLEWAMANLLNNPRVLKKAKDELDMLVGQERLVDEADLSKLTYLHNIIWETLRLHPAAPLLVPHAPSDDCKVGGYDVPRNSMLFVNAWAIHRDPTFWDDPTSFKPERFEEGQIESHKLMPFGMGRRSCPGAGLAQRVVSLTIGSLIQCFDWKTVYGKGVNMDEDRGGLAAKVEPLVAMCKPRPITNKIM